MILNSIEVIFIIMQVLIAYNQNLFGDILAPPHRLEVKPFLRVRFAQPLSVLHTSRTAVKDLFVVTFFMSWV